MLVFFATLPAIKSYVSNLISEIIATFGFVFILVNLGDFTNGLKPFIVGMLIAVIGIALGSTTGFVLNPARDFSPRLAYSILPVPNSGSGQWDYAWIPIIGPLIGGSLAVLLSNNL